MYMYSLQCQCEIYLSLCIMVSFLEYMYHDVKFCYQVDICNCLIFINHNLF